MNIDDLLEENRRKMEETARLIEERNHWYHKMAESFRDKGWIVYCRYEDSDNKKSPYNLKVREMNRTHPESRRVDFILCDSHDDIKGFAMARVVNHEWKDTDKRDINTIKRMMPNFSVFYLADDDHYETYLEGEYYTLLKEPMSPETAEMTVTMRKVKKSYTDLFKIGSHL